MRVLHVYRTYFPDPPGGIQQVIRQISLSTKNFGVHSTIFTLSPHNLPVIENLNEGVIRRSNSLIAPAHCDFGGIDAFSTFGKLAREVDLINYHFPWPFADLLHLISQPKTPAIITYHSDIIRQRYLKKIYQPLMNLMFRKMRTIVATSPNYVASSTVLRDPRWKSKVISIPLGLDESEYQFQGNTDIFERLRLKKNELYFLFVGAFRSYKGLQFLVDAARLISHKVVIAGSGPEEKTLRAYVKRNDIGNVVFAGAVTDREKVDLLNFCHAFVLPSTQRSEAFGMVLLEASMFGKPMITCDIETGTSYVNQPGNTGLVVKPGSALELANAMLTLANDHGLSKDLGRKARRRFELGFTGDVIGRAYYDLYEKILTGG
jgi:glycosyltransferase involved in cell wall biosynthesis